MTRQRPIPPRCPAPPQRPTPSQRPVDRQPAAVPADVLDAVAAGGADDAGGLDVALLGDFLPVVVRAAAGGRRLGRTQIARFSAAGKTAAAQGVALRALLDLYLSAAWRLWDHLPEVIDAAADPGGVVRAGRAVLRATDDVVAALAEGYQLARRELIRAESLARREFVDDLLNGSRSGAALIERAAGFGLTLAGSHAVAVVRAAAPFADESPLNRDIERSLAGTKADADALIATKDGRLVVIFAAPDRVAVREVVDRITRTLPARPAAGPGDWQLGVGRPHPGAAGVRESFDDALEALDLGGRLGSDPAVVDAADLLVYRVLLRDQAAIRDLMDAVLTPMLAARGGAQPLIDTLYGYFSTGGNNSATARAMHLSVRAVSYRLDRVQQLTGYRLDDPVPRFTLHTAVLGARLLGWPARPV
ncbi:PucR family transcriptional regulator [Nakamurella lactea]|uniref:PucR family transcriptional regulator n=1 Tax=Nakamurella lactea TaxID=459515 RepID=UPI000420330D|nr:helix-turn-helix domain-containing protein [Nakamurella lactea]